MPYCQTAYVPLLLALTKTVARKIARSMKIVINVIDIQTLNSIGLTGFSMVFVDTVRDVDIAGTVTCLLVAATVCLSISLQAD